jgi:PAS domain S-box-containing protein
VERQVEERTAELLKVNLRLEEEMARRSRAQEALRASEELHRVVLSNMSDAVFITDSEGAFTYVSPNANIIFDYSSDEIMSLGNVTKLLGRRPYDEAALRTNGEISNLDLEVADKSGRQRALLVNVKKVSIDRGVVLITCRDISERKDAEEEVRESEANYRAIFDAANDAMLVQDIETGAILDANQKMCEMFGWCSPEEARPFTLEDWSAGEASQMEAIALARIRQAAKGEPQLFEGKAKDKTGRMFWVEVSLKGVSIGGKDRVLAVLRDITLRKLEEEQLREQAALLDHAQDAIIVRDLEDRILYWNKSAERIYGWLASEAIGKGVRDLLYTQDPPQFEAATRGLVENGEWVGELSHRTKDGKEIIAQSRWALVPDDAGKPKSVFAIHTDITEKKKLEAQFLRAQRLESIGTLASGIAHNLGNVLAPILLSVQMLKRKFTDEESQHMLAILKINAERGGEMIKQVLQFAKGIGGHHVTLQPSLLINEIGKILASTLQKSIEIRFSIPENLSPIEGDATQLHQVLMNLGVNARDAMPEGGTLTIKAENTYIDETYARMHFEAKVGQYVVITVADTGIGIPNTIIDRIFEPFFTTKEQGRGTGLGLPSIRAIVKGHGGFINVYSEVGKGTEFQIYLPTADLGPTEKSTERTTEAHIGHGELILVVDDEAPILEIVRATLEENGYTVLTASDGIEALALYAEHKNKIKAVLMDMMMPYSDGPATIRELQKLDPRLRIIASSGLAANDSILEATNAGVKMFLTKPYTEEKLLEAIAQALKAN